jgi:hypothetical protein
VNGGLGNEKKRVETASEQERQGIDVELPQVGAYISSPIGEAAFDEGHRR